MYPCELREQFIDTICNALNVKSLKIITSNNLNKTEIISIDFEKISESDLKQFTSPSRNNIKDQEIVISSEYPISQIYSIQNLKKRITHLVHCNNE